ncbi:MAG: hypothetical protein AAGA35_00705 [Patescibacteria group bacterium]
MAEPTTTTTQGTIQSGVPDLSGPILEYFRDSDTSLDLGFSDVLGVFSSVWDVYVIVAYIFAALFMYGYVYAAIRTGSLNELLAESIKTQERLYREHFGQEVKNNRWQEVLGHIESQNPNDWRLAIIEADIMLEEALGQAGYAGNTLGERLKSITPNQLQSINDAWEAHVVRNKIAHAGSDFVLTQRLARDTITQFGRAFEELGVI